MKYLKYIFLLLLVPMGVFSQRVTYTDPERDDSRSMDFEIIGKVGGNYLVYKGKGSTHTISVYDNDFKLKDKHNLSFLPDRVIDADFIQYPNYAYIIYEHQKKGVLHSMAARLDSLGSIIGEPKELDTTSLGLLQDNKIYNVSYSEDKQKIMLFKIQRKGDKFYYSTMFFNPQLELQKKSRMLLTYEDRKNSLSDFLIDNEGNFVFVTGHKVNNRDYLNNVTLVVKEPMTDTFSTHEINIGELYLDELQLKVDNINKRYVINSLYYTRKNGDIEGIYSAVWDKAQNMQVVQSSIPFTDELKSMAKSEGSSRTAFNNFFIRNIICKRDGGFIIAGEDFNSQSRTNPWNRWDYLYGSPYSSYDYYTPNYIRYRNYYNSQNYNQTRYYYNNIVVFNMDKNGNMLWNNVIHKSQYDDDTDDFLSYELFNTGSKLHFLFNEKERKNQILSDQSVDANGELSRNPTLKSLDKGYEFMPRLAKQVGAHQIIVPCYYRNYICFAKIDYL